MNVYEFSSVSYRKASTYTRRSIIAFISTRIVEKYLIMKSDNLDKIIVESLRKGTVGQWKDAMTEELIKQFDDWTTEKLRNFPQLRGVFENCL